MKRILAVALLGALIAGSVSAQTSGTNTQARNGYYFNATTGQKTDANGNAYTNEASKDRDYYALSAVMTNVTIVAKGLTQTTFFPAEKYNAFQVHVKWTCTTAADSDSVALYLVPFGKTSSTDDGISYLLNLDPLAFGASDSLTMKNAPGILVTRSSNLVFRLNAAALAPLGGLRPARVVLADMNRLNVFGNVFTSFQAISGGASGYVSFPLGGPNLGGNIREKYIGFYVFNLSSTKAVQGITIEIWPKVN